LPAERVVPRDRAAARPDADGVFRLHYCFEDGQVMVPELFLRLRNNTELKLHYLVLEMTDRFGISVGPHCAGRLEAGAVAAVAEGKPMRFPVHDDGARSVSRRDWFKLIVSTDEISAAPFELPALLRAKPAPKLKRYRDIEPIAASGDWWSSELSVLTQPCTDLPQWTAPGPAETPG
jgi:hypothetical protein